MPTIGRVRTIGSSTSLKSYIKRFTGEDLASRIDIRNDAPLYMTYEDGELTKNGLNTTLPILLGAHTASRPLSRPAPFLPGIQLWVIMSLCTRRTFLSLLMECFLAVPTSCLGALTSVHRLNRSETSLETFVKTHGEPVAWGWESLRALRIKNINIPEWGDPALTLDGKALDEEDEDVMPVSWGYGVTPQVAAMRANLKGTVMGNASGHIIVLNVKDEVVFDISFSTPGK